MENYVAEGYGLYVKDLSVLTNIDEWVYDGYFDHMDFVTEYGGLFFWG